jgi:hypothetical protein
MVRDAILADYRRNAQRARRDTPVRSKGAPRPEQAGLDIGAGEPEVATR